MHRDRSARTVPLRDASALCVRGLVLVMLWSFGVRYVLMVGYVKEVFYLLPRNTTEMAEELLSTALF